MKQKKIATIALVAAMAIGTLRFSVPAKAADNSTDYTITIPATLTVAQSGWNATDGITAQVKSGDTFDSSKKLTVTAASTNSWALKSGQNTIGYNLATATGTYSSSATPASWEFSAADLNADGGKTNPMGIIVEDYSNKPAGTYQDTVTFTAKVENAAVTLATAFENGSTTVVSFSTFLGGCSITIANDNGNYSASGVDAGGNVYAKTAVQDGEKLILKFGFLDNNDIDGTITLDKSDNTYSINDAGYWDVYDLTSVVVNDTDVKSLLTKK